MANRSKITQLQTDATDPEKKGDPPTLGFSLACACTVDDLRAYKTAVAEDGTVTTHATIHVDADVATSGDLDTLPDAEAVRAKVEFHGRQPAMKRNRGRSGFTLDFRPLSITLAKDARAANFTGHLKGSQDYRFAAGELRGLRLVIDAELDAEAWEAMRGLLRVDGASVVIVDTQGLPVAAQLPLEAVR